MNGRTIWFFLALLPCGGCDFMLGVDGEYTTAVGAEETPPAVPQPTGQIAQVVTGRYSSCARTIHGQVKCWGDGAYGQLGLGNLVGSPFSRGTQFGEMGQTLPFLDFGNGRTAIDISAAAWSVYICAVLSDRSISCWGQLWDGASHTDAPMPVDLFPSPKAVKVTVGCNHACALLEDGRVLCWGYNESGQFGNGQTSMAFHYTPPQLANVVPLGSGRTAKAIAAGYSHTCALLDDGTVKCWGSSNVGALGLAATSQILNPASSPAIDFGGKKVLAISTSAWHVCALLDDKSVSCWGYNNSGQLGVGNTEAWSTPLTVSVGQPARNVSAGYDHTCIVVDDGTVTCWGSNRRGELGLEHTHVRLLPSDVADLGTGLSGAQVAAGYEHTCALLQNGTLKCWGGNSFGALGIGQSDVALGDEPNEMGDNLPNVLFF